MLFPIWSKQSQSESVAPSTSKVKLVKMVGGVPVEHTMSDVEQLLADKLATEYMLSAKVYGMYKRTRLYLWASVGANALMLAVFWL